MENTAPAYELDDMDLGAIVGACHGEHKNKDHSNDSHTTTNDGGSWKE